MVFEQYLTVKKFQKKGKKLFDELKTKRERNNGGFLTKANAMMGFTSDHNENGFSWEDRYDADRSLLLDFRSHPHPQVVKAQHKKHQLNTAHHRKSEKEERGEEENESYNQKHPLDQESYLNEAPSLWTQHTLDNNQVHSFNSNSDLATNTPTSSLFNAVFGDDSDMTQQ